jgi:hypothetical protein
MAHIHALIKRTGKGSIYVQDVARALGVEGKGATLTAKIQQILEAAGFKDISIGSTNNKPTLKGFAFISTIEPENIAASVASSVPDDTSPQRQHVPAPIPTLRAASESERGSRYGDLAHDSELSNIIHIEAAVRAEKLLILEHNLTEIKHEKEALAQQLRHSETRASEHMVQLAKITSECDFLKQQLQQVTSERDILQHQAKTHLQAAKETEAHNSLLTQQIAQLHVQAAHAIARKSLFQDEHEARIHTDANEQLDRQRLQHAQQAISIRLATQYAGFVPIAHYVQLIQASRTLYDAVNALMAERCLACAPLLKHGGVHTMHENAPNPDQASKGRIHLQKREAYLPALRLLESKLEHLRQTATRAI